MGGSLQTDGKLMLGGFTYSPDYSIADFALARYNTDGRLDTTFGLI